MPTNSVSFIEFEQPCDKCGEIVPTANNAVVLDVILGMLSPLMALASARHLIATDVCPGSPSRAQYLEGQPLDERPDYPYDERIERPIREAYEYLLKYAEEKLS